MNVKERNGKKREAIKREEPVEERNRREGNARGAFYNFIRTERVNRPWHCYIREQKSLEKRA